MDIGTEVWVKSEELVWAAGVIIDCQAANATGDVQVQLDSGEIVTRIYTAEEDEEAANEVHLRNSTHDFIDAASLTGLEYLHEPALLQALQDRFQKDRIYTSIGDILLSVNPMKPLNLYNDAEVEKYKAQIQLSKDLADRRTNDSTSLPPHVFTIGARAFGGLMRDGGRNQSILVSGESGSGKTESTKFLMQFLTSVAHQSTTAGPTAIGIGQRILQTNPILESFGNAQTVRNDNSSRFGKFIRIQFNRNCQIVGAELVSYLLEKVRLLHQGPKERNFHIFYELLEGASMEQLEEMGLEQGHRYALLNTYGSQQQDKKVQALNREYAARFQQTLQAFKDTGVEKEQVDAILEVLAALLHLGNVDFDIDPQGDVDNRVEDAAMVTEESTFHLQMCADLLGVDLEALEKVLLTRVITAGKDVVGMRLSITQATDVRRSLAKAVYGRLFSWLVRRLSDGTNYFESDSASEDEDDIHTIGILDIFGFETVDKNGFEQLCINYANERLQAQFNEFVFIKEQEVYTSEGIDWRSIAYPSNEACISFFDDKTNGLFSLLDQECLMPKGSNQALFTKLQRYYGDDDASSKYAVPTFMPTFGRQQPAKSEKTQKSSKNVFSASRMDRAKNQFVVHHFAGRVTYRVDQFLEKNQDAFPTEAGDLLRVSSKDLVSAISSVHLDFDQPETQGRRRRNSVLRSPSVSMEFKVQLDQLIAEIGRTEAHYVRCLKPNEEKSAAKFDRIRMVEQLRSVGVLEALRIARAGYSVRLNHANFLDLFSCFQMILGERTEGMTDKEMCQKLVDLLVEEVQQSLETEGHEGHNRSDQIHVTDVQVGRTMVFCRTSAFNHFSQLRLELRDRSASTMQRRVRVYLQQKRYQRQIQCVVEIQRIVRGYLSKKALCKLRQERREEAAGQIRWAWKRRMVAMRVQDRVVAKQRLKTAFRAFCRGYKELQSERLEEERLERERKEEEARLKKEEEERLERERKEEEARLKKEEEERLERERKEEEARLKKEEEERLERERKEEETHLQWEKEEQERREMEEARVREEEEKRNEEERVQEEERVREEVACMEKENVVHDENEAAVVEEETTDSVDSANTSGQSLRVDTVNCASSKQDDGLQTPESLTVRPDHTTVSPVDKDQQHAEEGDVDSETGSNQSRRRKHGKRKKKTKKASALEEQNRRMEAEILRLQSMLKQNNDVQSDGNGDAPKLQHRRSQSIDGPMISLDETSEDMMPDLRRSRTANAPHSDKSTRRLRRQIEELELKCRALEQKITSSGQQSVPSSNGSSNASGGNTEAALLRNIQHQMDMLRQSLAAKEAGDVRSVGSGSRRGRTGSSASSTGIYGMVPPSPASASMSGYGNHMYGYPESIGSFGSGYSFASQGMPRVVKWARSTHCFECEEPFNLFVRRHHCRLCGNSFCHEHSNRRVTVYGIGSDDEPVRVCDPCFAEHQSRYMSEYSHVRESKSPTASTYSQLERIVSMDFSDDMDR